MSEKSLEKFASILSSLTLPARLRRELGERAPAPDRKREQELIKAAREAGRVSLRDLTGKGFSGYGETTAEQVLAEARKAGRAFSGTREFAELAREMRELGAEREEAIAKVVAEHMATPFRRGKEEHLAFPALGLGLKKMRSKAPDGQMVDTLGFWRSSWEQSIAEDLKKERDRAAYARNGAAHRQEEDAALRRTPGIETLRESGLTKEMLLSRSKFGKESWYEDGSQAKKVWDGGVDLLEAARVVGSAETALPCAELYGLEAEDWPEGVDKEASRARKRLLRGLIPALICQALGDRIDPLSGARDMAAAMWIGKSGDEGIFGGGEAKFESLAKDAPRLAALRAIEAGLSGTEMAIHRYESYSYHRPDSEKKFDRSLLDAEIAGPLGELRSARKETARRIFDRAAGIALERQRAWMEGTGLLRAWDLAPSVERHRPRTSKLLTWIQANKAAAEEAKASAGDPKGILAQGVARALGVSGQTGEQIWEGVADGLAARGLDRAFAEELARDEPAREWVCRVAQETLPLKGAEKEEMLGYWRFGLACLSDGYRRGAGSAMALRALDALAQDSVLALRQNAWFSPMFSTDPNRPSDGDVLASYPPARSIFDAQSAKELRDVAAAKREKFESFAGSFARRLERLESGEEDLSEYESEYRSWKNGGHPSKSAMSAGQHALLREARELMHGSNIREPIDWIGADFSRQDLKDLVQRIPAGVAPARREALSMGPAGRVAAECVISLGIREAKDGIDLIAKAKGELKEKAGFTDGAWKALLKASEEEVDGFARSIRASREHALRSRAQEAVAGKAGAISIRSSLAMRSFAYGALGQHGIPREPLEALLRLNDIAGHLMLSAHIGGLLQEARHKDVEGADFFAAEVKAKAERAPFLLKAVCERIAKEKQRLESESPAAAPTWDVAAKSWADREWAEVKDWLSKSEEGVWQEMPLKLTWNWIWRAQQDWHAEMLAAEADAGAKAKKGRVVSWESPLGSFSEGEWSAIELTSGAALSEEGSEMRHCVSSYASKCKRGESRILSIRLSGRRVATLELAPFEGSSKVAYDRATEAAQWRIAQNRGQFNAQVDDKAALAFCEKVRLEYGQAHRRLLAKKREEAAKAAAERKAKAKAIVTLEVLGAEPARAAGPKA